MSLTPQNRHRRNQKQTTRTVVYVLVLFLISFVCLSSFVYVKLAYPLVSAELVPINPKANSFKLSTAELEQSYHERVIPEDIQPLENFQKGKTYTLPILMYHHVGIVPPHSDTIREDLTES